MRRLDDCGYATPAAMVISAAISLVITALVVRGQSDLTLARAELARTKAEAGLSSAYNAVTLAVVTSSQPPPYRWTLASLGAAFDVVAEPERSKLSPQAFAQIDDTTLTKLGAGDPAALKARMSDVVLGPSLVWIADQAASATWRNCAPSLVSVFGKATVLVAVEYGTPISGRQPGFWRAGEVWRIRVIDREGWRDERIVRFTGNGLTPAAVLGRRLSRELKGAQTCHDPL